MPFQCLRYRRSAALIPVVGTLLLALCPGVVRAQTPVSPPKQVEIGINIRAQEATGSFYLMARGVAAPGPDETTARETVARALTAALGGAPRQVDYRPLLSEDYGDEEEYDASDTPSPAPKSTTPLGWTISAPLDSRSGGTLLRRGLLTEGKFDPTPLAAVLRPLGVDRITGRIMLAGGGAPIVRCVGGAIRDPLGEALANGLPVSEARLIRRQTAFFIADIPTDPAQVRAAGPIRFTAGWGPADLWRAWGPLAALLAIPLGLTLFFQQRALRTLNRVSSRATDPDEAERARQAISLGYFRMLHHGALGFGLVWAITLLLAHPDRPLFWALAMRTAEARLGMIFLLYGLPPALMQAAAVLLSRPVLHRLKESPVGIGQMLLQTGGQLVLQLLPSVFLFLGLGAALDSNLLRMVQLLQILPREAVLHTLLQNPSLYRALAWLALSAVTRQMLQQIALVTSGTPPVVLGAGELYEQVHALAQKAGVKVGKVVFLATGPERLANAFAASGNLVVLTDRLLSELNRREVDAVIAHELAHLRYGHPGKGRLLQATLLWLPIALSIGLGFTRALPQAVMDRIWTLGLPVVMVGGLLLQFWVSRRWERVADLGAVRTTGSADALITGLARLHRLNGMPQDWSRWEAPLLTHPSTTRRAAYLAQDGAISPEELQSMLAGEKSAASDAPPTPEDRYPLPAETVQEGRIFSTLWRLRRSVALNAVLLLCFALAPLVAALLAFRTLPGVPALLVAALLGAFATWAAFTGLLNVLATSTFSRQETLLRARLQREGLLPPDADAIFVGLSPGTERRLYDGGGNDWDFGYLILQERQLRFVGERARFDLPADALQAIRIENSVPGILAIPRVLLSWDAPAEESGASPTGVTAASLRPASTGTLRRLRSESTALRDRLEAWRQKATAQPTGDRAEPLPVLESPGGMDVRMLARPAALVGVLRLFVPAAFAVGILVGLSIQGAAAMALAAAGAGFIDWLPTALYYCAAQRTTA